MTHPTMPTGPGTSPRERREMKRMQESSFVCLRALRVHRPGAGCQYGVERIDPGMAVGADTTATTADVVMFRGDGEMELERRRESSQLDRQRRTSDRVLVHCGRMGEETQCQWSAEQPQASVQEVPVDLARDG